MFGSLFRRMSGAAEQPKAAVQSGAGGIVVSSVEELAEVMNAGAETAAGQRVTPESAMRLAAVFACVRLISGALSNLPLQVMERRDDNVRLERSDLGVSGVLRRRPNRWQTPKQFKQTMTAHVLLRGNAFAQIVRSRGGIIALYPLDPDRMEVAQGDDLGIRYTYTRRSGSRVVLPQSDVFHLVGLSLDGVRGVSPIAYAREVLGLSMAQERHGAATFRNAARPSSVMTHPGRLGPEGVATIRASLDEYRAGGESEGRTLILEEGMSVAPLSMTAEDAQWIESRKMSRTDIAMVFGVPPHMIGDTEKTTSWGSGIEQQSIGFVTYTLEDHLTAWEETVNRDLIAEPGIYTRFNRNALLRGDLKTRKEFYVSMMQWGVFSPNEVRGKEDENPREGGDVYYDPPNMAGGSAEPEGVEDDDDQKPAED